MLINPPLLVGWNGFIEPGVRRALASGMVSRRGVSGLQ